MAYSLIFWMLAAICNAVMDTLVHHYHISIFKNMKNTHFWNPDISWRFAPCLPYTKYKVDSWHLVKSTMIICLALSIVFIWQAKEFTINTWWYYMLFFILLGIIWNSTFNIFYNHILKSKE